MSRAGREPSLFDHVRPGEDPGPELDLTAEAVRGVPADAVVDVHDAFCLHPLPDGGAVPALRGLSLRVRAGERLVLHGPNGSGKTTLLRVLVGEQQLAAGRAVVAGLDLTAAGPDELAGWRARRLGQIDQDPWRLLRPEFDVLDNVALQLRVGGASTASARDDARGALDRLGLAHLAGRSPGTLSGGERQRVAVCAALAHRPALVLADEPTGELDADSADAVYQALDAAVSAAGATLVLVTHDPRAEAVADRVVRIRDGRISETWPPGETFADRTGGGPDPATRKLVVDDRGWVWLPPEARAALGRLEPGSGAEISVEPGPDAIVLRAVPVLSPVPAVSGPGTAAAPATRSAAGPDRPLARLREVGVSYENRPTLDGFDLDVVPGRLQVLTGRSGSGKSTALRVLLGLQRPDAGRAEIAGTDLATCRRDQLAVLRARHCGLVLQQVQLSGTTDVAATLDLARAGRGLPSGPADDAEGAVLADLIDRLGLARFSHRPVASLSGGERQRVALARALAVRAALVVLDEPTSQLDEANAEQVTALLREVTARGVAVLAATHDPILIAAADEEITLGRG
jgi:ABC-type lipoprotein export system ATPase subunit